MAPQVNGSSVAAVSKIGGDYGRFVASRQQTEYLVFAAFGEDEHPSKVVRDKSEVGDRIGEVYDRMLDTDATLAGLHEKRVKAVTGLPWSIVPGDESDEGQLIADTVAEMLDGIQSLGVNLAHQLEAPAKGVAFDEMRWELQRERRGRLTGLWRVAELVDRPMHRFGFKAGALHVRRRDGGLEPVPPGRILHLAHGTKDTPWGKALLDRVWWFYWLSLHGWKYYGVAVEKWAQPTVRVAYKRNPDGTVNEQVIADALALAADIQTEYAIAHPEDIAPVLMEAVRSGSITYEAFIQLLDRAKALFFLGEVDTSGMSQGPGSFAKNRVSNEVRYETILADASEVSDSLTDGLIAPFVRHNFGVAAPMPYWEFDVEEAADRELRQRGVAAVLAAGEPVPEPYFYRVHQVPRPRRGQRVIRGGFGKVSPPPPAVEAAAALTHWADQELAA